MATPQAYSTSYSDWLLQQSNDPSVQKSDRTRYTLLAAAAAALQEKNLNEVSVAEIVARAGTSRPSFYTYFTDLNEILKVLLLEFSQLKWYDRSYIDPHPQTVIEGIRQANIRYCRMYEQNSRLCGTLAYFALNSDEVLSNNMQLNARFAHRTIERMVRSGIAMTDEDALRYEASVLMLIAMTEGTLRLRYIYNDPTLAKAFPTPEAIAASINEIWHKTLSVRMIAL